LDGHIIGCHDRAFDRERNMRSWLVAASLVVAGTAQAQQHHRQHGPSPYAGSEPRAIKALSEQQIADLQAGRGMGLALAAELNGYPGPLHTLELADRIGLTVDQRRAVQELFDSMKAEAIAVGQRLIASESEMDRSFNDRTITPQRLAQLSEAIGVLQGELRAVHLGYHLRTAAVLTAEQSRAYASLRGYR
jgi:hypothetical protein